MCQNEENRLHFDTHAFFILKFRKTSFYVSKRSVLLEKDGDLRTDSCLRIDAIGDLIFVKNA